MNIINCSDVGCTPVEAAAGAARVGLGFLAEAGSYLRAAALDSRRALNSVGLLALELLDLAECRDPAVPDCLHTR